MTEVRQPVVSLAGFISGGIWPALPLTGYWLLPPDLRQTADGPIAAVTAFALWTVTGIVVWSGGLLAAAAAHVYRGTYFGLAGWAVVLVNLVVLLRCGGLAVSVGPTGSVWDWVLIAGLVLAAGLYLGFPHESIGEANDMGVYANHGIFIARHGRLDVPYPWQGADPALAGELVRYSPHRSNFFRNHVFLGFQKNGPRMTVEFGHVWPVWLAQAFSTVGPAGLFRLNGVFALLALGAFHGLCRTVLPAPAAVAATLFLALVPSQVWIARTTLSEVFTQLAFCAGLLVLLHALTTGSLASARWAGAILAFTAFIRCDSFLLLPLLVVAQLGQALVGQPVAGYPASAWLAFQETAVPGFLLAVGYFAFFSRPYFRKQFFYFRLLGVGTVAAVGLRLVLPPFVGDLAQPWLAAGPAADLVGGGMALLAAYAYWVRPVVVHYRLDFPDHPNHGQAHRAEYSLQDLGRYLSPPVLGAAVAGWWLALRGARSPSDLWLLPWLVIAAGYAGLYLYDPCDDPPHFWRVRRYVPVIIPGFIFFAAVAACWGLEQLPEGWRELALAGSLTWLGGFTIQVGAPFWWRAEDPGTYEQIRSLAELVPPGDLVFAAGSPDWVTPLAIAFDRRVVHVALNADCGWKLLARWVAGQVRQGKPAYLLCEHGWFFAPHARELGRVILYRTFLEPTLHPVPCRFLHQEVAVVLVAISGPLELAEVLQFPLGGRRVWGVAEVGFHSHEMIGGQPVRWTNGHGKLMVPIGEGRPGQVLIDLAQGNPNGGRLRVLADGCELFDGPIDGGRGWFAVLPLADIPVGRVLTLELISNPLVPSETLDEPMDSRRLGVLVREVRLLAGQPPNVLQTPLGGRRVWGVAEGGFHDQEAVDGRPVRWTDGHGRLTVPIGEGRPGQVLIDLAQVHPKGGQLRVLANGRELFDGPVGGERGWCAVLPLGDVPIRQTVALELISNPFVPAETIDGSLDTRVLGVQVREVRLLAGPQTGLAGTA
jgi:hypothetical protein